MRKLIALLSVPLIAFATSCKDEAPVESDYFTCVAPIDMGSYLNASVKDFDKDGQADAIISNENKAIFYVKGYEKEAHVTKESIEMTPELREDASNFIKANNTLRYHAAKEEYDSLKARYDTTGVKK